MPHGSGRAGRAIRVRLLAKPRDPQGEGSFRPSPVNGSISGSEAWRRSHPCGQDGAVRDLKLLIDPVQVDLDRALRDDEPPTDVLVGQPLRDQARNLVLPGR